MSQNDLVQRLRREYYDLCAEAADRIEALEIQRCNITGNPIGTDTVIIGAPPCECQGCRNARRIEAQEEWNAKQAEDIATLGSWIGKFEAALREIAELQTAGDIYCPSRPGEKPMIALAIYEAFFIGMLCGVVVCGLMYERQIYRRRLKGWGINE